MVSASTRRRSELGLIFVGVIVVVFADLLASLGKTGQLPDHAVEFITGIVVLALAVHLANRWLAPEADPVIVPIALVLNGIGYVEIGRLDPTEAGYQLAWSALGAALYIATLAFVRRSRDLERYRYLVGLVAFVLLLLPLMPHFGEDINGARLWVAVGPITFQPVEIAKILLVIFFASYFIEKRELLTTPTVRLGNHLVPDMRAFGPIVVAWACSMLILLAEHDIGFSLLLFVMFIVVLWVATGRWTYLAIGVVLFAVGTFAASHLLAQVNERFAIWLNPWPSPVNVNAGYQPIQAELAFGRGALGGTGLGLGLVGSPGVLPVPTSDFIFAALGEELGLLGTSAIVVAFLLLVGTGLRTALRARTEFAKLTAVGLTASLGFQAFFIMSGVLRLLPLTGVTLPFVSYGGSSLAANYILLALLMRISHEVGQSGARPAAHPLPVSTASSRGRFLRRR